MKRIFCVLHLLDGTIYLQYAYSTCLETFLCLCFTVFTGRDSFSFFVQNEQLLNPSHCKFPLLTLSSTPTCEEMIFSPPPTSSIVFRENYSRSHFGICKVCISLGVCLHRFYEGNRQINLDDEPLYYSSSQIVRFVVSSIILRQRHITCIVLSLNWQTIIGRRWF